MRRFGSGGWIVLVAAVGCAGQITDPSAEGTDQDLGNPSRQPDGGAAAPDPTTGGKPDSGATCVPTGLFCDSSGDCCSGLCAPPASGGHAYCHDVASDAGAPACRGLDQACGANGDCCSRLCAAAPGGGATVCQNPTPGGGSCTGAGGGCASDLDCCSTYCQRGVDGRGICSDAPGQGGGGGGTCRASGATCASDVDCCSTLCQPSGGAERYCS